MRMQQPNKSVVDSVTAACSKVLRSVKLLGDDVPPGVTWETKDPRKAYKFGQELGHGNYGVVHVVTHIQSGRVYACKIIRKPTTSQQRQHVVTEVAALHRVSSHPNVASLKEVWEDAGYIYVIMEACLGGELFDVILQRGHFSERDAAVIIKVILEVVGFCHESGVIHRDLKPENFLLKRQALDPQLPLRPEDVRAVDFGLAFFLEPNQSLRELLGSPFYVAPELLRGKYGYPADVWSIGVILYILLSGSPPFTGGDEREVFHRVLKQPLDLTSEPWPRVSAGAKDLVAKLLTRDPQQRLTTKEALEHHWVKSAPLADTLQSTLVMSRLQSFAEMSKLQGILMNLIAKNLSSEGIGTLRDAFNALDTNGDGYLSFEELRQGLGDASQGSQQCGSIAQAVMDALDVTGDGIIDYHEFLAAVVDRQQTLTDQTLVEMFAYLDKNNDGLVSAQELSDALAESDIKVSHSTLRQLMADHPGFRPPADDSGEPMLSVKNFTDILRGGLQSEQIQLTQLESALSDMQVAFRMQNRFRQLAMLVIARATPAAELQGLRELFQSLDVDNSGCLTMDELRRGLKTIDHELSEDEIESLLDFMDVDGSNTIDYHEFVMGILEDKHLLTEAKLRAAFNYFDTDGNGKIDISEVERVVRELNIKMKHSPRDLVACVDANEDHVVDFAEFREMMLSAEPNLLITRQQSLALRNSGISSASSSTLQGSIEKALKQPASLRPELRNDGVDLVARHAAIPQDMLSRAAASDLPGEEARKLIGHLPNPPETDAQALEQLGETVKNRRFSGDSARSSEDQMAVNFEDGKNVDVMAHPFSDALAGSWNRAGSVAQDSPVSSRSGSSRQMSLSRSFRERSSSLPNGSDTRQGLHHARSKSTGGTELSSGTWRGRQLVFLGSSRGRLLSMKSGDLRSIESIMRRASMDPEGEEVDDPLPASSKPSSQLGSPRDISRSGTSRDLPDPSRIGDVQETIFENEELATRDLNRIAPYGSTSPQQKSNRGAHADLTVMLSFMEDQWSKASLLAKGKEASD